MDKVLLVPLALVMAVSAACGGTSGGNEHAKSDKSPAKSVDRKKVEQAVSAKLVKLEGQASKSVSCPQGLKLAVNASTRCTLITQEGVTHPVTATVASIKGETPDLKVVSPWVSRYLLGQILVEGITSKVTVPIRGVDCPGDLKSQRKATMTCSVTTETGNTHTVTVTVATVTDKYTDFDWAVKD